MVMKRDRVEQSRVICVEFLDGKDFRMIRFSTLRTMTYQVGLWVGVVLFLVLGESCSSLPSTIFSYKAGSCNPIEQLTKNPEYARAGLYQDLF